MHTLTEKKLLMLKPGQIRQAKNQPRKSFDEGKLKVLANSIALIGIVQPITVRKCKDGYEIISGERRLRAAIMAGLRRVPCVVHKTDERTAAFYAIAENLQHSSLNFFEEAQSINNLIIRYRLTVSEAAMRLGLTQGELISKLKLLRIDQGLQKRIITAQLTERHARALLRLDEEDREDILSLIIADNLSPAQTEEAVTRFLNPEPDIETKVNTDKEQREEPMRKTFIGDTRIFCNSLEKLIATIESSDADIEFRKNESSKYIEYKFKIKKDENPNESFKQLKIC